VARLTTVSCSCPAADSNTVASRRGRFRTKAWLRLIAMWRGRLVHFVDSHPGFRRFRRSFLRPSLFEARAASTPHSPPFCECEGRQRLFLPICSDACQTKQKEPRDDAGSPEVSRTELFPSQGRSGHRYESNRGPARIFRPAPQLPSSALAIRAAHDTAAAFAPEPARASEDHSLTRRSASLAAETIRGVMREAPRYSG